MKTFEKVLEIFREYLDCDLEEEVLPCREGYLPRHMEWRFPLLCGWTSQPDTGRTIRGAVI